MLYCWASKTTSTYVQLVDIDNKSTTVALSELKAGEYSIYCCGYDEDGHVKNCNWSKEYVPVDYSEGDSDNDK